MIAQFLLFAAIGTSTPGQCILLPEWVYPTNGVPTLLGENIPGLPSNRFHKIDRDAALSYFAAIDGYYERKMRPLTAEQVTNYWGNLHPYFAISTNFLADAATDANRMFTNCWRRVDSRLRQQAIELANEWREKPLGRPGFVYYGSSLFGDECKDWITYSHLTHSNAVELGLSEATNGLWLGINNARWFGETYDRGLGYNSPLMMNDAVMYMVGLPDPTFVTNRTQTSWTQLVQRAGGRAFTNAITTVGASNMTRRVTGDDIAFATEVQAVVDKTYHGSASGYAFRPDEVSLSGGAGNAVFYTCNGAELTELIPLYDEETNFTARARGGLILKGMVRRNEVWNESVATNRVASDKYVGNGQDGHFGAGVDFGEIAGGGLVRMRADVSVGDPESIPGYFLAELEEGVRYPVRFYTVAGEQAGSAVFVEITVDGEFRQDFPIGEFYEFDVLPADLYKFDGFVLHIDCKTDCTTWRSEDTGLTLEPGASSRSRGDVPFLVPHRSQLGNVAAVSVQWYIRSLFSWYDDDDPERHSAGGFDISAPHGGFTPENYNSLVGGMMRYTFNEQLNDAKRRVLAASGAGMFDNPIASLSGHFDNIANGKKSNLARNDNVFGVNNGFISGVELIVRDGAAIFVFAGTNEELPRDPYFGTVANYESIIGVDLSVDEGETSYEILNFAAAMPIIYWKFSNLPCSD